MKIREDNISFVEFIKDNLKHSNIRVKPKIDDLLKRLSQDSLLLISEFIYFLKQCQDNSEMNYENINDQFLHLFIESLNLPSEHISTLILFLTEYVTQSNALINYIIIQLKELACQTPEPKNNEFKSMVSLQTQTKKTKMIKKESQTDGVQMKDQEMQYEKRKFSQSEITSYEKISHTLLSNSDPIVHKTKIENEPASLSNSMSLFFNKCSKNKPNKVNKMLNKRNLSPQFNLNSIEINVGIEFKNKEIDEKPLPFQKIIIEGSLTESKQLFFAFNDRNDCKLNNFYYETQTLIEGNPFIIRYLTINSYPRSFLYNQSNIYIVCFDESNQNSIPELLSSIFEYALSYFCRPKIILLKCNCDTQNHVDEKKVTVSNGKSSIDYIIPVISMPKQLLKNFDRKKNSDFFQIILR